MEGGLSGGVGEQRRARDGGMEFWTRFGSYRELVEVEGMAGLEGSGLVIFKVRAAMVCFEVKHTNVHRIG